MDELNTPVVEPPKAIAPKKTKNWPLRILFTLLLLIFGGIPLYIFACFSYDYSSGERVGFMQKLSLRGWVCKTYEGELAMVNIPGQPAEKFIFSIRDKNIANEVDAFAGQKVVLHYRQHKGLPTSCFGDTEYFVDAVRKATE